VERIGLRRRKLDKQRMDTGPRFVELTVIGKNERVLR